MGNCEQENDCLRQVMTLLKQNFWKIPAFVLLGIGLARGDWMTVIFGLGLWSIMEKLQILEKKVENSGPWY